MKSNVVIMLVVSMIIVSCKNKKERVSGSDPGLIEITKSLFESEKMEIGEPLLYPFSDLVYFTGTVIPSIEGKAQISLALPGKINRVYYKPGQQVDKGSVLFEISGNGFVDLQKDFAESSAMLAIVKSNYDRAKELYAENISTKKDYILAESNYFAENAKYNALKIKLESMGLEVSKIEKGGFYSSYFIKSPIRGFIASLDATLGQYVEPQQKIAEIIDSQSFQLRLSVFEENINKIKSGQKVTFYLNGNKSEKYNAKISTVGQGIVADSKSIECYAKIENLKDINIVSNQSVEGEIYTSIDSVLAVPVTAIINTGNESYLLRLQNEDSAKYTFKKLRVITGRKDHNYVELIDQLSSEKLLLNGLSNIQIE